MKKLKLAGLLAVASAMAATSGVAQAADYLPSQSNYTIHFSGATASAQFVKNGLIDRVCLTPANGATKNITMYEVDGDDWNVICQVNPAAVPAATAGDVVMFVKQGGGSGDGTTPVLDPVNNPITYQKAPLDDTLLSTCTVNGLVSTGLGTSYSYYSLCGFPVVSLPGGDMGLSDVEPNLFFDVNTPSTGNVFNDPTNAMTIKPLAALEFGVGITTSLARALQSLQFASGSMCHPATSVNYTALTFGGFDTAGNPTYTTGAAGTALPGNILLPAQVNGVTYDVARVMAGSFNPTDNASPSAGTASLLDTEACMPSLSKTEIVGLFTGGITDWGQIHNVFDCYGHPGQHDGGDHRGQHPDLKCRTGIEQPARPHLPA